MSITKNTRLSLTAATAIIFGVIALFTINPAIAGTGTASEQIALTGTVSGSTESGFALIEAESEHTIALAGPADLTEYVGSEVSLIGSWSKAEGGERIFNVIRVEAVPAR